jgi:hypothetical protein
MPKLPRQNSFPADRYLIKRRRSHPPTQDPNRRQPAVITG